MMARLLSDQNLLHRAVEWLFGGAWLWMFRLEGLLLGASILLALSQTRRVLREIPPFNWKALGILLAVHSGLLFWRTKTDFFGLSEEWEELLLAKLAYAGDIHSFKAVFRHGTTWPFLLGEIFRCTGPRAEIAIVVDWGAALATPLLVFLSATILFRNNITAWLGALLVFAWPSVV